MKKRKVYIIIDDRTNRIAGVFSKRNKAAAYMAQQSEPCWFMLYVYNIE